MGDTGSAPAVKSDGLARVARWRAIPLTLRVFAVLVFLTVLIQVGRLVVITVSSTSLYGHLLMLDRRGYGLSANGSGTVVSIAVAVALLIVLILFAVDVFVAVLALRGRRSARVIYTVLNALAVVVWLALSFRTIGQDGWSIAVAILELLSIATLWMPSASAFFKGSAARSS